MGYEIELVVGTVHKETYYGAENTKGKQWFQIFANVDMRKLGYDSKVHNLKSNATPVHLYSIMGDGDTSIVEDRYGAELKPLPIQDVIDALRSDIEESEYRRLRWALALLEEMQKDVEDLQVVLWGY